MELIPDIRICGDDYSVKIKLCGLGEPLRFDTGTNPKWLLIKEIHSSQLKNDTSVSLFRAIHKILRSSRSLSGIFEPSFYYRFLPFHSECSSSVDIWDRNFNEDSNNGHIIKYSKWLTSTVIQFDTSDSKIPKVGSEIRVWHGRVPLNLIQMSIKNQNIRNHSVQNKGHVKSVY